MASFSNSLTIAGAFRYSVPSPNTTIRTITAGRCAVVTVIGSGTGNKYLSIDGIAVPDGEYLVTGGAVLSFGPTVGSTNVYITEYAAGG